MVGRNQLFKEQFESTWGEFDAGFKRRLLDKIRELGSLYRLSSDRYTVSQEIGRLFYEALETTMAEDKTLAKLNDLVTGEIPLSFNALEEHFKADPPYPLHTFVLLVLFISKFPLRAYFSGRNAKLPFNTLRLKFTQKPSDPLPTAVDYELEWVDLNKCPWQVYDASSPLTHPSNHIIDLVYIWHF